MLPISCIVLTLILSSFSPLGLAMLNRTLLTPHPNPEEVAQEVQRYNAECDVALSFLFSWFICIVAD